MSGDSRRIVGAANPRALAELRAGRAIDWSEEDGDRLLTQLLDMPIERLVDPKYGSPIYAGVPLDFSRSRCVKGPDPTTDLRRLFESTPEAAELVRSGLVSDSALAGDSTSLRQLGAQTADALAQELQKVSSPCVRTAEAIHVQRAAELATATRLTDMAQATRVDPGQALHRLDRDYLIVLPEWLHLALSDLRFGVSGEYFVDAPTATSPVQGALGDCWLIAAMASVAWTRSEQVAERIRRTNLVGDVDAGDADFRYDFTDVLPISIGPFTINLPFVYPVWVGERIPETSWGGMIYARSAVPGETWPAVIEKAMAVWRSGGDPNYPRSTDYGHLNGGDPAWALHVLIGGSPWYHWADADDTWSTIRSHCSGPRTSSPLVAWTWGSSDDSPTRSTTAARTSSPSTPTPSS